MVNCLKVSCLVEGKLLSKITFEERIIKFPEGIEMRFCLNFRDNFYRDLEKLILILN